MFININVIDPIALNNEGWRQVLSKPVITRTGYTHNEQNFTFSQVRLLLKGVPQQRDEYEGMLYSLLEIENLQIFINGFDKTTSPDIFQSVQDLLLEIQQHGNISLNRFMAFVDTNNLIPLKTTQPTVYRHLLNCYRELIRQFLEINNIGYQGPRFRRFFIDTIKWTWNHLAIFLENSNFFESPPKIVWYGETEDIEAYFLHFLVLIGCDVVLIQPTGENPFINNNIRIDSLCEFSYEGIGNNIPFPKNKPLRQSTLAYKATQELDAVIRADSNQIFQPWQLRNHIPIAITFKTTYSEVFLIANEKAFIRPNFLVEKQFVYVPNVFAKIVGESNDKRDFEDQYKIVANTKNSFVLTQFPFSYINNNFSMNMLEEVVDADGNIDPEKLCRCQLWPYTFLPNGLQFALACAIGRNINNPKLKRFSDESEIDVKQFLLSQALVIPTNFIILLQQFDYSQDVPKVVIKITRRQDKLFREDAALLLLLNEIGIDIIIYNPFGLNDIEFFVEDHYFNTHWLEKISSSEELENNSQIQRRILSVLNRLK